MKIQKQLYTTLKEKNYKITFAESCTGGAIASAMVDVPGSSSVFEYGFITYSKESKINILNVKKETIDKFGIVSTEVAKEMVIGATEKSHAQTGISVTGCAGPGVDSDGNLPGTVCFGFRVENDLFSEKVIFENCTRNEVRTKAVDYAFSKLNELLHTN